MAAVVATRRDLCRRSRALLWRGSRAGLGDAAAAFSAAARHLPPPFCDEQPAARRAGLGHCAAALGLSAAALAAASSSGRGGGRQGSPRSAARCESAASSAPAAAGASPAQLAAPGEEAPEVVEEVPRGVSLERSFVRIYQFESCPFCRKVRSCLDFCRIPYEVVEVNPLSKTETKPIAPDYKKVPILQIDTDDGRRLQLRDSKKIIRALLGVTNPGVKPQVPPPSTTPSTGKMWPKEQETGGIEEQWVTWTDKVLVQCMVLNVYRTLEESAETFSYLLTHPAFPWFAQRSAALSGTVVMWGLAKARKRKYGVDDERAALFEAVETFAGAVERGGGPFLGGERPGAVDFNVYGILRSAEACQTERDVFEGCPRILPWYGSMRKVVGPSCAMNATDAKRGS